MVQLRQFLKEQERLLLAQLGKLDKEIVRIQNENVSKLSKQISHLSELISELEGKCQKPASEFLQDVRSTLSRCEKRKFEQPEEISPEVEERVSGFSQKTTALLEALRKFKGAAVTSLLSLRCPGQRQLPGIQACPSQKGAAGECEKWSQPPPGLSSAPNTLILSPANVTLDPDTAHHELVVSEDRKRVRWERIQQRVLNTPERYDTELCVLGCEGFTSGRHCWEVEVGDGGGWAVGVARESVRRNGGIFLCPEWGIWAVGRWEGQFWALTSPVTPQPLSRAPSRIRVCLDCDRGQVTFIDAGDEAPIFTFPLGSVPGERIQPWFWVEMGSRLSLCP
nr:tripartite motif-containing protein 15-like [Chelonoidis abingdonii]